MQSQDSLLRWQQVLIQRRRKGSNMKKNKDSRVTKTEATVRWKLPEGGKGQEQILPQRGIQPREDLVVRLLASKTMTEYISVLFRCQACDNLLQHP